MIGLFHLLDKEGNIMQQTVYLAGPISGQSYGGATNWRVYTTRQLALRGIDSLDPMRGKAYLSKEEILADSYDEVTATIRGITTRDRFDCMRASVALFNFDGADSVSIGSCIELGWADSKRIPVIVVMTEDNPHWHGMVREIAGYIVETLDEAIDIACAILA